MKTPSLQVRVVVAGVVVMAAVLALLDVFVYLNLERSLQDNLDELLDTRARLVAVESANRTPEQLVERLTALGVRATVRTTAGQELQSEPPSPVLGTNLPPAADATVTGPQATQTVALPDGSSATVFARRTGIDDALHRLLVLEVTGSLAALLTATLLLLRVANVALHPLEHVAAVARRRAAGHTGERLEPDRPHTRIGQMAAAYDAMVEELETALVEARAAEAHSRHMEERARQIVETATDAFVAIDINGAIVDWNEGAERLLGWTAAEVAGRDVFETVFPAELRAQHRERLASLRASGERRRRGRRTETVGVRRDGSTFAAELVLWATGEPGALTVNAFVHDVTDRRRAEAAVHRLAAIVDSSDDAVLSTDLAGTVMSWNPAARRMYGYSSDEVVGQPITHLVPTDRHHEIQQALDTVRRGEAITNYETVRLPKHGPAIDVAVTISPIRDASGAVVGASSIARDITEQRWLATTLDTTLSALESALDEARTSEARSRRFLADAAHQLRTPMTGIRACAETLLRSNVPAERDRLLADLVRETTRASRLMASLLKMARLDQGEELVPVACDVRALCTDEIERARVLSPDLTVTLDASTGQPATTEADPNAVKEILANLLDNARRHAVSRVDVAVRSVAAGVEIVVGDDGGGVPEGLEERIFERFVSLDGRGGSGLGLAIARSLARAGGGELSYQAGAFVLRLGAAVTSDPLTAPSSR